MNTIGSILARNRGRNPMLLAVKWERMRENAFGFFRGTAPLFYRNWAALCPKGAPLGWIGGDAHMENLGSYKGANRVPYFDINDFDECCLAPVDWDLGRALTALCVVGKPDMASLFLASYASALAGGKPGHIEPEVAEGQIAKLLSRVADRNRKDFLEKWISKGRIRLREGHTFPIGRTAKAAVRQRFEAWARRQPFGGFYRVMDICGRVAGNGSLGLERYVVLVNGRRQPYLLDVKEAAPAAPLPFLHVRQPPWRCEAERVATVQNFMQYVPIARLSWFTSGQVSFILHELQPIDDRIEIDDLSASDYEEFVQQWGRLVASGHLRSGGWKGSGDLDALIGYGQSLNSRAQRHILAAASAAASAMASAFADFKKSRYGKASRLH